MSGYQFKIWCPNCMRALYLPPLHSGEYHKHKCEHCSVKFEYDRYGQVKRLTPNTEPKGEVKP